VAAAAELRRPWRPSLVISTAGAVHVLKLLAAVQPASASAASLQFFFTHLILN